VLFHVIVDEELDADPGHASVDELFSQLRSAMGSGDGTGSHGHGLGRVPSRAWAWGAVVVVLTAGLLAWSWARPVAVANVDRPLSGPAQGAEDAASSTTAVAPERAAGERVWPPAEAVSVAGNEVRVGGVRWEVGSEGDLVAVGDWNCDGEATPGVLRPTAGRLWLFDRWSADGAAREGPVAPPATAVSFEAEGCGRARVTTSAGEVVAVETMR
jgi:hypothetical protein